MSAYDITHGIGGLWEVHRWTSASGLVFDLNVQDVATGVRIDQIPGLNGLPPHENPQQKKPGRHGTVPGPRTYGAKTPVYTAELFGPTLEGLVALRSSMVAAFADLRPGSMQLIRHPDVGGPTGHFTATVVELEVPEIQDSNYFRRQCTLGLSMDDPRVYFPSLAVDESGTDDVTVTNPGNADTMPVVTVTGVGGDVTLTDGTHTLTFKSAPAGDLVIDFDACTGTVDDDLVELDSSASDWWDEHVDGIAPLATVTITQTGGTGIQVQFTPAVWG